MIGDLRRNIDNSELARIVESFSASLVCWKVGLRYGSLLYFEMGEVLEKKVKPGVVVPVGAASLVLEGYNWTISKSGRRIADSRSVSLEIADSRLAGKFNQAQLETIQFIKDSRKLVVRFSHAIVINSVAQLSGEYVDDNLCLFLLPDGRVLGCDPKLGFFVDGSISQLHAKRYAQA